MLQVSMARGWDLEVERGPDWLFVRPCGVSAGESYTPDLADDVWSLLEQNFAHRVVLELDAVEHLDSQLIGQLIGLCKRLQTANGLIRLCGLSERNADVLHSCRLEGHLPIYHDRADAVMGNSRAPKPK